MERTQQLVSCHEQKFFPFKFFNNLLNFKQVLKRT